MKRWAQSANAATVLSGCPSRRAAKRSWSSKRRGGADGRADWGVADRVGSRSMGVLREATSRATFPIDMIPYGKKPRSLPAVLSRAEVTQLFTLVPQPVERL